MSVICYLYAMHRIAAAILFSKYFPETFYQLKKNEIRNCCNENTL